MPEKDVKKIITDYQRQRATEKIDRQKLQQQGFFDTGQDTLSRIEYDVIYSGRRVLVVHHLMPGHEFDEPVPMDWYCGYLQILPSDPQECLDEGRADEIFKAAPGGITLTGSLPLFINANGSYVGFDTMHYGMQNYNKQMCVLALEQMIKEIPRK